MGSVMGFLLSILGGLIGFLLAIGIIILIIYFKIRSVVGKAQMKELGHAISNAKNLQMEAYSRDKHVVGMTSLLEPRIRHDFPEFNKDLLFSITEKNLRKIFNCIESKDISIVEDDQDMYYVIPHLEEQIEDMKSNKIEEKFDNIVFNKNAISAYSNDNGRATIKVSTSLSYYYYTNRKDKNVFSDVKKATRYTSEFVYVYDETKFESKQVAIMVHCKNCNAPIRNLGVSYCEYCMAPVERINLKAWKMASYKEDYN